MNRAGPSERKESLAELINLKYNILCTTLVILYKAWWFEMMIVGD
jgi:hypothetical protein